MKPLELSIIIVSFNTKELLADCLRSLRRVSGEVEFETIVVDNGSSDGSGDAVERQFQEVKLLRLHSNVGFAAAMNAGIEVSRAPLFLALNPDTIVPAGTLKRLRDFMQENSRAAVAGAVLTHSDGSLQASTFRFPSLFREFWNFLPEIKALLKPRLSWNDISDVQQPRKPVEVDCVSGAALVARTEVVKQIGGFDSDFFLYHEEMDLCTRLKRAGWGIWSVSSAQVMHLDARASGYRQDRLPGLPLLSWRVQGMDRLWQKHKSPREHRLWRAQARILLSLRMAVLAVPALFLGQKRDRIRELRQVVDILRRKSLKMEQKVLPTATLPARPEESPDGKATSGV